MRAGNVRREVLVGLFLLSIVTYLDRVCINSAGPEMQQDLGLSTTQWGYVVSAFLLAYGVFEVPGGWLGDRFGPRLILTRIVVWWSAFTALTGMVRSYVALLIVRALFGAGEAGAYPNASCAISRWFPPRERARAQGIVWMASRLGGALTPFLVYPLVEWWGWRSIFYAFSLPGIVWAVWWWKSFRDYPQEHPASALRSAMRSARRPLPDGTCRSAHCSRAATSGDPGGVSLLRLRLELVPVLDGKLSRIHKGLGEIRACRLYRAALSIGRFRRLGGRLTE